MSETEHEAETYTLGMLERLRQDLRLFGNTQSDLYSRVDALLRELANPNLHDINLATAVPQLGALPVKLLGCAPGV